MLRVILVAGLSILLLLIRKPDAFLHPDFWAEDGTVFWRGWIDSGLHSFIQPYAGYLLLVPRTIAAASAFFPMRYAVDVFLAGTIIFTAWSAVTIALTLPGLIGVLASLSPLLAYGVVETLGTPTNLQWILCIGMAAIAVSRFGAKWPVQVNNGAFLIFSALTGPFSVLAGPVFLARAVLAWRKRATVDFVLSAMVLTCAAVQAYFIATGFSPVPKKGPFQPLLTAFYLVYQSVGGWVGVLSVAILIASVFVGKFRIQRIGLIAIAVAILASVLVKNSQSAAVFASGTGAFRYWYAVSSLVLLSLVTLLQEPRQTLRIGGIVGILAMLSGYFFQSFIVPPWKHYGTWAEAIDKGAGEYRFPPGWVIKIPPIKSQSQTE